MIQDGSIESIQWIRSAPDHIRMLVLANWVLEVSIFLTALWVVGKTFLKLITNRKPVFGLADGIVVLTTLGFLVFSRPVNAETPKPNFSHAALGTAITTSAYEFCADLPKKPGAKMCQKSGKFLDTEGGLLAGVCKDKIVFLAFTVEYGEFPGVPSEYLGGGRVKSTNPKVDGRRLYETFKASAVESGYRLQETQRETGWEQLVFKSPGSASSGAKFIRTLIVEVITNGNHVLSYTIHNSEDPCDFAAW